MSNKTECKCYNEDDFVEREGSLHEITVEITLCEYRNLIQERIYNEKEIERLQEENRHLNDSVEILTEIYVDGNPELKETLSSLAVTFLEQIKKARKEGGNG